MSNYDNEGYIGYFQRGFTSNDINIENGLYVNNNFTIAQDIIVYGTTHLQPYDISVNIFNLTVTGDISVNNFVNPTEEWTQLGNNIYNDNSGNVGIGLTDPSYNLDVSANIRCSNSFFIGFPDASSINMGSGGQTSTGYGNSIIGTRTYNTNRTEMLIFKGNRGSSSNGPDRVRIKAGGIAFDTYSSNLDNNPPEQSDRNNENIRMYIDNLGNVGIGTSTPNYKMEVSGNVFARFTSLPNYNTQIFTSSGTCIASNGRMWVAGGTGGSYILAYSYNGNVWYPATFTNSSLGDIRGVAWGNNLWIAVGSPTFAPPSPTNCMAYSTDGISWTSITISSVQIGQSVAFGNNRWVIGGVKNRFDSTFTALTYSTNNYPIIQTDWSGASSSNNIFTAYVYAVRWNGSIWLAGGEYYSPPFGTGTSNMAFSTDGITWSRVTTPPFFNSGSTSAVRGLAYRSSPSPARWVAVGEGTGGTIAYSNDISGFSWTNIGNSIFFTRGHGVDYNGSNRFVATGYILNTVATSTDGISWSGNSSGNSLLNFQGYAVKYDASFNKWAAVGETNNRIITSDNGTSWISAIPSIPHDVPIMRIRNTGNEASLNLYNSSNQHKINSNNSGNLVISRNGSSYVTITSNGTFSIGPPNTSFTFFVNGSAYKNSGANWTVSSDLRIKEEIENADLSICYNNIKNLPLRRFKWIDKYNSHITDKYQIGYLAQELKNYFPKSITITEQKYGDVIFNDFHIINIDGIIKSMYGTLQLLMKDFEIMRNRINYLKNEISILMKKNSSI
jgi:hypothetical protein